MKIIAEILNNSSSKEFNSKQRFDKTAFDFFVLINNWKDIIGPHFSRNSLPVKLTNKTLTIITAHSTISHQLSYIEEDLLKRIHELYPELSQQLQYIKYKVNQGVFLEKQKQETKTIINDSKTHPYSPVFRELKKNAEKEFENINDSEIRDILISLKIQSDIRKI